MVAVVVWFGLLIVAFYFAIVRPQRRRATAHRNVIAQLEVGDEVITGSGIFGRITEISEDRVKLEIAPGTVIAVARAAIGQVIAPSQTVIGSSDSK